jgi:glycosyltransferase involved in cell wall biosynthesis
MPPNDAAALAGALARVLDDRALRARLAEGARQVRETLPTWHDASRQLSAALT